MDATPDLVPPPYQFEGRGALLAWALERSRLPDLPAGFEAETFCGRWFFLAGLVRYLRVTAPSRPGEQEGYDEIAYCVPVRWRGGRGIHYFHLDVSLPLAVRLGREIYGFPKALADFSIRLEGGGLRVRGPESAWAEITPAGLLGRLGAPWLAALARRALAGRDGLFPVERSGGGPASREVVRAPFAWQALRLEPARVRALSLPWLHLAGWFPVERMARPTLAWLVREARFTVGPPERG